MPQSPPLLINPLPKIVWLLALPMIMVELIFNLAQYGFIPAALHMGWRTRAFDQYGFFPDLLRLAHRQGDYALPVIMRFLTYPFLHFGFTHAAIAIVMLLALGKAIGSYFSSLAILILFFASATAGAIGYSLFPFLHTPLLGAYPAIYGFIGAFTYMIWRTTHNPWQAFKMIGVLITFQIIFALSFGGNMEWIADLFAFGCGFLLGFVLAPGALSKLHNRLKQR